MDAKYVRFHGTPNMRVRMNDYDTNVLKACGGSVYYDSGSDSDLDSASIESNGMSSLFEGKIDYRISNTHGRIFDTTIPFHAINASTRSGGAICVSQSQS